MLIGVMSLDARVAERLRALPKIDDLVRRPELACLPELEAPRWAVAQAARALVERRRQAILGGAEVSAEVASEEVAQAARALARPSLRPVTTATTISLASAEEMAAQAAAFCFPRGRVKFWHPRKESAPLQGQAVLYLGGNAEAFRLAFVRFGFVVEK